MRRNLLQQLTATFSSLHTNRKINIKSTHIFKIKHVLLTLTQDYLKTVNLFSILEMEVYKCTHLYTHLSFFLLFLASSFQVHPGIQELSQDLSVLFEPLISDTAGSSFSACPAVSHNIGMNFKYAHNYSIYTAMALRCTCLLLRLQLCITICPCHLPCSI